MMKFDSCKLSMQCQLDVKVGRSGIATATYDISCKTLIDPICAAWGHSGTS